MTPEQRQQLAYEADRVLNDDTLKMALALIRSEALERLATVDATSIKEIQEAQAVVRVSDGFVSVLKQFIIAGTPQKKPVVA